MDYQYDISVIVPIYNVEQFLPACLDSIARQTKDNMEVVMLDDGSTDDSGRIADKYAQKYENFFVYHIENGGLGHGRNYAVEKSHGKYIIFIDSDDIVTSDIYEKMFCIAEKNNSDMTICNVERFNSSREWHSGIHSRALRNARSITHIKENHDLLYDTTSWNKLIRRDFWDKYHFQFPENILYEDIPVTIPMHYLANNVSTVKSIGYLWRVRDQASKSITQNTSSLRNLKDRIEILRMLDKFFEENVSEKELCIDKELKALRIDLIIFVKECISPNVGEEQGKEIMALITEYINEAISDEAFSRLSYIEQYIYKLVMAGDYAKLCEAMLFRSKELVKLPIIEENGRFDISIPENIFGKSRVDYTNELSVLFPYTFIKDIVADDGKLTFTAHLYFPRVNIAEGEQELEILLYNEFTGEGVPLDFKYIKNDELTSQKGVVFCKTTGETAEYNYDGTGVEFTLDLGKLEFDGDSRAHSILINYKNRLTSGATVLHNMYSTLVDWSDDLAVMSDDKIAHIEIGAYKTPSIYIDNVQCTLLENSYDDESITLKLSQNDALLKLVNSTDKSDVRTFEVKDGGVKIPVDALVSGDEYELYTVIGGKESKLLRSNKSSNLIHTERYGALIRSNKTHNVRIRKFDAFTCVRDPEEENGVVRFKTTNLGAIDFSYNKAQIVIYDEIAGVYRVLAKNKVHHCKDGRLRAEFEIDFNDDEINSNLYKSRRSVMIEYLKLDVLGNVTKSERHTLISRKHFKHQISFDTIDIRFFRETNCVATLNLLPKWSEEENSIDKRKALMDKYYADFRKEPLNEKMVVFESMWGTKFSCNPRAIYEYIQKNHPDYECVWLFDDERTPISGNGRRVRRGSLEYYKVLAQAKYFFNNVNFEDDYIKRDGQIEVQTMHGTPYKTLGLDVTDDFPNKEVIEHYVARNRRWDYLIVQGKFTEDKAYDMFRCECKMLETGYPRCDALYHSVNASKIKENLSIPKDKKVILYVPTWRVRNHFDMELELDKMREALSDEYVLLIRIHHLCSNGYDIPADNKFIFNLNDYTNLEDLYKISDVLITDYSSIMFDYALLDKPMLFFAYDLESYAGATRGVYFDIKTEAPGPLVYTTDEVIDAVKNIDSKMAEVSTRAQAFKEKYLTYECPDSAKKVVEEVMNPKHVNPFVYKLTHKKK